MKYFNETINNVNIEVSSFNQNSTREEHLYVRSILPGTPSQQFDEALKGLESYLLTSNTPYKSVIFLRFFVSDAANQKNQIDVATKTASDLFKGCAISIVQQPPLTKNKVTLWAYTIDSEESRHSSQKITEQNNLILKRKNYEHIWTTQLSTDNGATDSYSQTQNIFKNYTQSISSRGHDLKENCLRTWLFVKDIDFNYGGVVEARKELFNQYDMTPQTHFIASTGIEGRHISPNINVMMDAYSVLGVKDQQIKFLTAPDHLNPTHEYGVTFERGTSIDYGDRRHIFISGTASIDNKGDILHTEDVAKQVERVGENITALLADADSTNEDIAQMIIYLRDLSDAEAIAPYLNFQYRDVPKVVVHAPVCRPGWLVEIECIAIRACEQPDFETF